jgi:hypothetical protein
MSIYVSFSKISTGILCCIIVKKHINVTEISKIHNHAVEIINYILIDMVYNSMVNKEC